MQLEGLEGRWVPASVFSLASDTASVVEGTGAPGTFTSVELTVLREVTGTLPTADETVSVLTVPGTATAGADYVEQLGTVTFPPPVSAGIQSATLTVLVVPDALDEVDETFVVYLSNPSSGGIDPTADDTTVTIFDDDALPSVTVNDVTVFEGSTGVRLATFRIDLSSPSGRNVSFFYQTTDGTASVAGNDYQLTNGTATISAGRTSVSVTVPVIGDATFEANETFLLSIGNVTNATIARSTGSATILNDDSMPTISVGDVTAREATGGNTIFNFPVVLSGPVGSPVVVTYTIDQLACVCAATVGTGPDADVLPAGPGNMGTVTIPAGATTAFLPVTVVGDGVAEIAEDFEVRIEVRPGSSSGPPLAWAPSRTTTPA